MLMSRYEPQVVFPGSKAEKQTSKETLISDWRERVYVLSTGEIYCPAVWFEKAMIHASGKYIRPIKGKKTWAEWMKGNMVIQPDELLTGLTLDDFKAAEQGIQTLQGNFTVWLNERCGIHAGRVNVGQGLRKASITRVRPLFLPGWELTMTLVTRDFPEECPEATLRDMLEQSGVYPGVGDYRPEKGGRYGQYEVVGFKLIA
jgi:hypothetical protein